VLAKRHARAVADGFPDALEAFSCASRAALGFEDVIDRTGGELERSQSAAAQVALRVADRKICPLAPRRSDDRVAERAPEADHKPEDSTSERRIGACCARKPISIHRRHGNLRADKRRPRCTGLFKCIRVVACLEPHVAVVAQWRERELSLDGAAV
jgi:hypothetical protein